jgi:hypothetical protein
MVCCEELLAVPKEESGWVVAAQRFLVEVGRSLLAEGEAPPEGMREWAQASAALLDKDTIGWAWAGSSVWPAWPAVGMLVFLGGLAREPVARLPKKRTRRPGHCNQVNCAALKP